MVQWYLFFFACVGLAIILAGTLAFLLLNRCWVQPRIRQRVEEKEREGQQRCVVAVHALEKNARRAQHATVQARMTLALQLSNLVDELEQQLPLLPEKDRQLVTQEQHPFSRAILLMMLLLHSEEASVLSEAQGWAAEIQETIHGLRRAQKSTRPLPLEDLMEEISVEVFDPFVF